MIYDQRITNFASETWLRELREMEADDVATACVYQGGVTARPQEVARPPLTLIPTRVTTLDDDPDECESPVCFYRSLHESRRSDTAGEQAADAVVG